MAVPGVRVHGTDVKDVDVRLDSSFRAVPVATKLGVPLMWKKMSGTGGDDSHIRSNAIVRFMADPGDGFAPLEWQYGGRQGPAPPVVMARRDKVPFSKQDFDVIENYMTEWMESDEREDDGHTAFSERFLTHEAFQKFVRSQAESWPTACLSAQFPIGCTVVPNGLSVAELNGKEGEVVQYSRDRVGVKYADRGVTALKPERLTLVREAPAPMEVTADSDAGMEQAKRQKRVEEVERKEAYQIASRFVSCLNEDSFPEMDDLHLFGIGSHYKERAQEALAVWQGAVKHGDLTTEQIAEALGTGSCKELFMRTCHKLADSQTPNSTYAKLLIGANFAALEWDTL